MISWQKYEYQEKLREFEQSKPKTMDLLKHITELKDEGQFNYEERRGKFPKREPLPNYFDCLDSCSEGDERRTIPDVSPAHVRSLRPNKKTKP